MGIPFHEKVLSPNHCRLCWLYHNRADYRALWRGDKPHHGTVQRER